MTFLVINCGTSSIRLSFFYITNGLPKKASEAHLKHLFSSTPLLQVQDKTFTLPNFSSYSVAIEYVLEIFKNDVKNLKAIGHRVVHGGELSQPTLITPKIEKDLQDLSFLAPLHNPPSLEGIESCKKLFPELPQIAVFDTSFHKTLPLKAAYYPLPWGLSKKHKIKRYGFHGIAHQFNWQTYSKMDGSQHKVISIHLGSGCSLTAIDKGVSIDTSMGFTPLDGVMMATRCGELDPSILAFLCDKEKKSPNEITMLLNHQSGLLGVSQKTSNMEELLQKIPRNPQAQLAVDMFVFHILKKIGAFIAVLKGADALVFSGGIGENSPEIRYQLVKALDWLSVRMDEKKNGVTRNLAPGNMICISKPNSKIKLYVVGCDENQFIVQEMLHFKFNEL